MLAISRYLTSALVMVSGLVVDLMNVRVQVVLKDIIKLQNSQKMMPKSFSLICLLGTLQIIGNVHRILKPRVISNFMEDIADISGKVLQIRA
jgi:hypothetical protein